jgi:hypothetical protein
MAISQQPRPEKLVPHLQTSELPQRKVLSNCFLQEKNVHFIGSEIVSQLVSATSLPKPSNVPNKHSHLETLGETRAWRAGVFLRIRAHTGLAAGTLLFRLGLDDDTKGIETAGIRTLGVVVAAGRSSPVDTDAAASEAATAASEAAFSLSNFT